LRESRAGNAGPALAQTANDDGRDAGTPTGSRGPRGSLEVEAGKARTTRTSSCGSLTKSISVSGGVGGRTAVVVASSFASQGGCMDDIPPTRDAPHGEAPWERVKRHLGWEDDAGLFDKVNMLMALFVRPFFVLTMATMTWDPLVNIILPMTMCIFIPYANPFGNMYEGVGCSIPNLLVIIVMWLAGAGMLFRIRGLSASNPVRYVFPNSFDWMTFLTSLLWVGMIANEVVGAMQTLGVIMGVPPMAMGITLLAWGNCVDNVFATIGLAKAGEFAVALTGIYAAPMFDMFGNGFILLILASMRGGSTPFVMSLCPKILMAGLLVILLLTVLGCKFYGWKVTRNMGIALAISYPVFLVIGFWLEDQLSRKAVGAGGFSAAP